MFTLFEGLKISDHESGNQDSGCLPEHPPDWSGRGGGIRASTRWYQDTSIRIAVFSMLTAGVPSCPWVQQAFNPDRHFVTQEGKQIVKVQVHLC